LVRWLVQQATQSSAEDPPFCWCEVQYGDDLGDNRLLRTELDQGL
jgi:hypothetical protein